MYSGKAHRFGNWLPAFVAGLGSPQVEALALFFANH